MKIIALSIIFIILSMGGYAEPECDYSVEVLLDSNQFAPEDFRFKIRALRVEGPSTNITAQITIAGNGSTIKNYRPWTNLPISKQKTSNEYSPNLKDGVYEIKAQISTLCEDFSMGNNMDERIVLIRSSLNNSAETKIAKENEKTAQNTDTALNPCNPEEIKNGTLNNKNNSFEETKNFQAQNKNTNKIIYESSNEKAKDWILIMLLAISIILNIILIWKR